MLLGKMTQEIATETIETFLEAAGESNLAKLHEMADTNPQIVNVKVLLLDMTHFNTNNSTHIFGDPMLCS